MVVCLTGASLDEERRAEVIVRSLGGTLTGTLQEGVSCLVVKSLGSTKHRAAIKLGIPCVMYQWLLQSQAAGSFRPFADFPAGPFADLVICCTQLEVEDRQSLEALVRSNGGVFSKMMEQGVVTHLVAKEASGDKFNAAKLWNVPVVSLAWVHACISERKLLPELPFRISLPRGAGAVVGSKSAAAAAAAAAASGKDPRAAVGTLRGKGAGAAASAAAATAAKAAAAAAATAAATAAAASAQTKSPPPSRPQAQAQPASFLWEELPPPSLVTPERSRLLEGDTFFLAGFQPQQRDYLVGLLCAGGARRHQVLTVGVTKVLVGSEVERRLLLEVKRHPSAPAVVRLEWLVDVLVPGFLEQRREARRERERERLRERERERERARAAEKEQALLRAQRETAAAAAAAVEEEEEAQGVEAEEKENTDNDGSRPNQQQHDSQSFEQGILRMHEAALQQQQQRGGASGNEYDASNSDNSQDTDLMHDGAGGVNAGGGGAGRALRRGRSLGGLSTRQQQQQQHVEPHRRSLGQAGRGQTVSAITGLKRPSRPIELDWRPANTDEPDAAAEPVEEPPVGRKKGRGSLFPAAPIEESQYVTWHE